MATGSSSTHRPHQGPRTAWVALRRAATSRFTLGALLLLAAACSRQAHDAASTPPARAGASMPPARSYALQGEVVALPDVAAGRPDVLIRHQPIPDFVTADGEVVAMEAMTMPFTLARGVSLAGLGPGQAVTFTLQVDWAAAEPMTITHLAPGPAAAGAPSSPDHEP